MFFGGQIEQALQRLVEAVHAMLMTVPDEHCEVLRHCAVTGRPVVPCTDPVDSRQIPGDEMLVAAEVIVFRGCHKLIAGRLP